MIDLTKHLTEGMQVYSALSGEMEKVKMITNGGIHTYNLTYNADGSWIFGGECMLFRDKDRTPWEGE